MELTKRLVAIVALASGLGVGCADHGFDVAEDGLILPATLEEALTRADRFARDSHDDAYLWEMGGGYTITDAKGDAYNHTFRFYAPRRERRLDVHLFAGTIWAEETVQARSAAARPVLRVLESPISSDAAISIALAAAADSLPAFTTPEELSARLSSIPVWPERLQSGAITDSLAWRIDVLEERSDSQGSPVWWSLVRVYVHPITGQVFEVVDAPQVYPNL